MSDCVDERISKQCWESSFQSLKVWKALLSNHWETQNGKDKPVATSKKEINCFIE